MAFVTLTQARRNLAERMGGYRLFTSGVQDDPPDGTYVGVATGPDARRKIVSSDIAFVDTGGSGSPARQDAYKYSAIYVPSIPIQRMMTEKSYAGARIASDETDEASLTDTNVGVFTLAEQLSAALAAGLEVEKHTAMAPISRDGRGLHACINRALRASVVRDMITMTTVSGAGRYSMASYPWLDDDDLLIGVSDSETLTNVDSDPLCHGGSLRVDGDRTYLLVDTQPSSSTFYVHVWRPRSSWVQTGGTWQASTVGLVNETDAVVINEDWLTFLSYVYACEALKTAFRHDPAGGYWAQEWERWSPLAEQRLKQERTLDLPLRRQGQTSTVQPLVSSLSRTTWP